MPNNHAEQLLLVARLYYIDGLSQSDVARIAGVSQSKISRLLAEARARGVVQISVPEYDPRRLDLENRLKGELGLADAIVVRTVGSQSVDDLRHSLGYFAAPLIAARIAAASTVALAGGRSIEALAARMTPMPAGHEITFAQAMGNIDAAPGSYDVLEVGRALARQWKGAFLTLNTPALLPDADTCRRLLELEQVRSVMERIARADLAVVGVGTPENSVFIERKVLAPADLRMLRDSGAVGEILGRYFDERGAEMDTPLRDRVVSLALRDLKRIPSVVAVVAGGNRAAAIRAAIRGGLIKSLVLDENGARDVLGDE